MESTQAEEDFASLEGIRPNEAGEMILAFRPLAEVPESLARRYGPFVYTLNLTETGIRSLATLRYFTHLKTLILDNNSLDRLCECPRLDSVTTLWFNNNQVSELPSFLDDTIRCFPKLVYFSMMRNPAAPGLMDLVQPDLEACKLYRLYTLYRMPGLQLLDSTAVTQQERMEAKARGHFASKRRPSSRPPSSNPYRQTHPAAAPSHVHAAAPHEDPFAAAENTKVKQAAAYLGVARRRYDGRHSEGNRFIIDSEL